MVYRTFAVSGLGIKAGGQLASRLPNAVIGRAIGLIIRNIAGFRPGSTYMGTFGYPLAFALAASMFLADIVFVATSRTTLVLLPEFDRLLAGLLKKPLEHFFKLHPGLFFCAP